jgi:hypothetical protein
MSDTFRVDIDGLRVAGPRLEVLGDVVATTLARLSAVLDAEGACWGQDEAGQAFAGVYQPAEVQGRAALRLAGERLSEIGAAAGLLADVADAAEQHARQRLT